MRIARFLLPVLVALFIWIVIPAAPVQGQISVDRGEQKGADLAMVAKIREEGLQRSELPEMLSFMTDV